MILKKEIEDITNALLHFDECNASVSKVGVDWHLNHLLIVLTTVCEFVKKSDPKKYKWSFNYIKTYIFIKGSFPRGKARVPKAIINTESITKDSVINQIEEVKVLLQEITKLPKKSHFKHPLFGVLNLKETIKFLRLHTRHHLKIIDDICA